MAPPRDREDLASALAKSPAGGVLENELRERLRDHARFPRGVVSLAEPALGADLGLPDAWLLVAGSHFPLELKRGRSPLASFRPSQRQWHKAQLRLGARTFLASILDEERVLLAELTVPDSLPSRHPTKVAVTKLGMWREIIIPERDFRYEVLQQFMMRQPFKLSDGKIRMP